MDINLKKIAKLAKKHGLRLVVLFGSYAEKKIHPESDLDIAFYPGKKVNEEKLYNDFIRLLRRADVDLVNLFTTHDPLLRFEALSKGKLLYEAERGLKSRMEWQSYVDYVDFKKYYDMRSEMLNKKLKEMAVS